MLHILISQSRRVFQIAYFKSVAFPWKRTALLLRLHTLQLLQRVQRVFEARTLIKYSCWNAETRFNSKDSDLCVWSTSQIWEAHIMELSIVDLTGQSIWICIHRMNPSYSFYTWALKVSVEDIVAAMQVRSTKIFMSSVGVSFGRKESSQSILRHHVQCPCVLASADDETKFGAGKPAISGGIFERKTHVYWKISVLRRKTTCTKPGLANAALQTSIYKDLQRSTKIGHKNRPRVNQTATGIAYPVWSPVWSWVCPKVMLEENGHKLMSKCIQEGPNNQTERWNAPTVLTI